MQGFCAFSYLGALALLLKHEETGEYQRQLCELLSAGALHWIQFLTWNYVPVVNAGSNGGFQG